ncbi:MAG: phosphatase PAP2 family protein [Bacillota bacterium]|nr:phosphatase PAP2 family protein [Bacillota bacterium]
MEVNILLWFQNCVRQEWLTPIMEAISFLGKGGWFFLLTTLVLCINKKTRKLGFCLVIAIALEVLINNGILKPMIHRTRPYIAHADVLHLIGKPETDFSFPSGHTGIAFAWAYAIYFAKENKKWGILALCLGVLMAISRMYLGFHYPTDVLVGFVLGMVCAYFAYVINKKYMNNRLKD